MAHAFHLTSHQRWTEIVFDDGGMNVLSSRALEELGQTVRSVGRPISRNVDLLVFRGGRPQLFAAGADMREMSSFDGWDASRFSREGQELFQSIENLPFVTLVVVDGDCFGGALDLALSFDLRWATSRSRFSHPGARIGIATGFGGTSRWRAAIEPAQARKMFLGNEVFPASTALNAGLIDRMTESPRADIDALLDTISDSNPAAMKQLARISAQLSPSQKLLMSRTTVELHRRSMLSHGPRN